MRGFSVAAVCIIVALCAPSFSSGASLHHRTRRQLAIPREFQNIRVENYLKNPRAVKFQLNCLIYDGPCDTIGKFLKQNISGWLHTQCESCDDEQKKLAGKLIGFFQRGYPKEWNDAVKKYKGEFTSEEAARFEEELGLTLYVDEPAGGSPGKIDFDGLVEVVKEAKEALKATKAPIVLTKDGVQLTTPKGFNLDDALKRAEALADKHLPALRTAIGAPSTPKSHSSTTEAPKPVATNAESEVANPDDTPTGAPIA